MIGKALRELRKAQGISPDALANAIGVHRTAYFSRERGDTQVKSEEYPILAEILGVPVEQLRAVARGTRPIVSLGIPIINRGPAGEVIDYLEWGRDSAEGFAYMDRDEHTMSDRLFAVVVDGESMAPDMHSGDIIIFESVDPTGDEMPEPGCIAFVRLSQDAAKPGVTICIWTPLESGEYRLDKKNPAYSSMTVPREHVEQFAVARWRKHRLGR